MLFGPVLYLLSLFVNVHEVTVRYLRSEKRKITRTLCYIIIPLRRRHRIALHLISRSESEKMLTSRFIICDEQMRRPVFHERCSVWRSNDRTD